MNRLARLRKGFILWILCATFFLARSASATIRYTISLAHPEQHLFHVTMVSDEVGRQLIAAMPAWNATYDIRDFAYRVTNVRATGASGTLKGAALHVVKLDKQTWEITAPDNRLTALGSVSIQYDDYWDEPGPFSSQLNSHHAFLNLAEVLLYVPARRREESEVDYTNLPPGWRVAQELPSSEYAPEEFIASSYDALVDATAEIGTFSEFGFEAGEGKYKVVIDGTNWNQKDLEETLQKIVSYETGMMRDVPFHQYMFIFHFGPYAVAGGGGMEHANGTSIAVPSGDDAANVAAHEFFHLWNVKRIRPQTLEPVDYTKEMWTRALWFAEGVTSTYAAFTMVRTGLWNKEQFYEDLARQFTQLEARPAHLTQSAEESSLDTWLDKYPYYNRPEVSISYYNKGQILGVMLDLAIRNATDNHKSLDDVMRAMDDDYAHRGRFYDDSEGIEREVEKVSGKSFKTFFEKYVAGTAEIPYGDFLRAAGLQVNTAPREMADLGFETSRGNGGSLQVAELTGESQAAQAGLETGDQLLQIDGQPVPRFLPGWLSERKPGEKVTLRISRDGTTHDFSFPLGSRTVVQYSIEETSNASERQKRILEGMLEGTTN